jgi:DNA polymerase
MSRIFINYRRQDSEGYVGRLYDFLLQHFGREDIFMDVDSLKPGIDFVAALETAVAECDVLLAIIGPGWAAAQDENGERRLDQWNDFVRLEIKTALDQNKRVIPVLVGRAKMPAPTEVPEEIRALVRRSAIEISHQRFASDMDQLVTAIKETVTTKAAVKTRATAAQNQQKEALFKAVRADLVGATTSPLYEIRTQNRFFPVLGEGSLDARIMFIGESPGRTEATLGKPFCGPSGEVLEEMLNSIQLKREDVFLTNLLLDFPGTKREPTPEEIAYYIPFVDRLIDIIQPPIIATLGRFAMQYLLKKLDLPEKRQTISQIHGKLIKTQMTYGEIYLVPLYHPAVVLYTASQKDVLRQDFARLKLFL